MGTGMEDLQMTSFLPLPKFISGFTPTKTCEKYLKEDMCSLPSMAPAAQFIDFPIDQCKQCSQQSMTNHIDRRFPGLTHDMVFAAAVFTFELQVANLNAEEENEFYRQYN